MNALKIFTDGGARGNPGPAAIGVVVYDSLENKLLELSRFIGIATNNVAEYQALIAALNWLVNEADNPTYSSVTFYLDSNLVINQMLGKFKLKNPKLKMLYKQAKLLEQRLALFPSDQTTPPLLSFPGSMKIHYIHIPRELNKLADNLVNQALDKPQHLS